MAGPQKGITPEQKLAAYKEHGSYHAAARSLGVDTEAVRKTLKKMNIDANEAIPDGYRLKGTSTLYRDGEAQMTWVKTTADVERQKAMMLEVLAAMKDKLPKETPVKKTSKSDENLASCYILTDYHLGQFSCKEECGTEWNTELAEAFLVNWFKQAIHEAPASHTAILGQLGDFLHYDGLDAVTPTSKHPLDADVRFQILVRVAIRVLRRIIKMLLEKHEHVHVIMAEGNHDLASSAWLREVMKVLYADEPRITVDDSSNPYYAFEWGKTSIFMHHGHKKKMEALSKTFTGMFRDIFGRTEFSYIHTGHLHHAASKEDELMLVKQHQTLAPKDSHSARGGYKSGRGASVFTYHKQFGFRSENYIPAEMIK